MERNSDDRTQESRLKALFEEHQGYLQRKRVIDAGIDPHLLSAWVEEGRAERLQRGLYRDIQAPPVTNESLLEVAIRVPHGVVCLRSALAFHDLGTVSPAEIDLAIPNKARTPTINYPPVRFYYFTDQVYRYGIYEHETGPATIKVYTPEKTLADLLYYRKKLGNDIFLEGLQAYMRRPRANPALVMEAARVRRVQRQMRAYLEALT
jgi:predicted transcriptional regulator of viral defense system